VTEAWTGRPDLALTEAVRHETGPIVAYLYRLTGDFDVAEEAVHDAVVAAVEHWRRSGIPPRPGAWLTVTARRKAIDRFRREAARGRLAASVAAALAADRLEEDGTDPFAELDPGAAQVTGAAADDRVAMLFGCCHPALAVEARLALTLRSVVGLTTEQIARAFLVPEATLAQRIVRAKRKIVGAGIRMQVPTADLAARLDDVLTVVYLTYNAGFVDPDAAALAADSVWLAELVTASLPSEPEAWGLLALVTLQDSRTPARFGPDGTLVLLSVQDRAVWDGTAIARAERYLERASAFRRPGRFQLQAAIAACHASAPAYADTDWLQILTLYDVLLLHDRSPVVRLNRAVALAAYSGPEAGLAEVEALGEALRGYHLWHATRAELLRRLGRDADARRADAMALALAATRSDRTLLQDRLAGAGPG
jgi:RNA polymerase sigma factor (sigma-70 family)